MYMSLQRLTALGKSQEHTSLFATVGKHLCCVMQPHGCSFCNGLSTVTEVQMQLVTLQVQPTMFLLHVPVCFVIGEWSLHKKGMCNPGKLHLSMPNVRTITACMPMQGLLVLCCQ